jgi:hypothetical protein
MVAVMTSTSIPAGTVPTGYRLPNRRTILRAVLWMLTLAVVGLLTIHHYGDPGALNAGWTVGTNRAELGFETVGDPGVFGHISTAVGTLSLNRDGLSWCAVGRQAECES